MLEKNQEHHKQEKSATEPRRTASKSRRINPSSAINPRYLRAWEDEALFSGGSSFSISASSVEEDFGGIPSKPPDSQETAKSATEQTLADNDPETQMPGGDVSQGSVSPDDHQLHQQQRQRVDAQSIESGKDLKPAQSPPNTTDEIGKESVDVSKRKPSSSAAPAAVLASTFRETALFGFDTHDEEEESISPLSDYSGSDAQESDNGESDTIDDTGEFSPALEEVDNGAAPANIVVNRFLAKSRSGNDIQVAGSLPMRIPSRIRTVAPITTLSAELAPQQQQQQQQQASQELRSRPNDLDDSGPALPTPEDDLFEVQPFSYIANYMSFRDRLNTHRPDRIYKEANLDDIDFGDE